MGLSWCGDQGFKRTLQRRLIGEKGMTWKEFLCWIGFGVFIVVVLYLSLKSKGL